MRSRETSSARKPVAVGFTLIELLIVLAIFLLLSVGSFSLFRNVQVSTHLNEQSRALINALRSAQILSLYGKGYSSHGMYVTTGEGGATQIIQYQGASYASRATGSEIPYTFPLSITLTRQMSTTTPEIIFNRNTGMPSATGSIVLDLAGVGSRTISINRLGAVEELDL